MKITEKMTKAAVDAYHNNDLRELPTAAQFHHILQAAFDAIEPDMLWDDSKPWIHSQSGGQYLADAVISTMDYDLTDGPHILTVRRAVQLPDRQMKIWVDVHENGYEEPQWEWIE